MKKPDEPLDAFPLSGEPNQSAEQPPREWIVQRCTQHWIGTELQYEDWPAAKRSLLMTRAEMLAALNVCAAQWPQYEFRGHNAANCHCPEHRRLALVPPDGLRTSLD